MDALNPKAQAVVQEAREGLRPPAGERERLEALLDARLGAMAPAPRVEAPTPPRMGGWRFVPPLAIGAALIGGAAFLALRPSPVETPAPVIPAAAAPAATLVPPAEPAAVAPAEADPLPEPAKPIVEPQRPEDRLAQEVALLSKAMSDLRAGRAAEALKLLDEHQRKFPRGVLGVERRGARAQALCSLKRVAEGRAELARLAPQSPAAGRAKQVCDAASAGSDGK
ncbi:MAG: hypothetical protein ABUL62_14855 [Myxococcales bacterium]